MHQTFGLALALLRFLLTHDLGEKGVELDQQWVPREANALADALANEDVAAMDPGLWCRFQIKRLTEFRSLLDAGAAMYAEAAEHKRRRAPNCLPPLREGQKMQTFK